MLRNVSHRESTAACWIFLNEVLSLNAQESFGLDGSVMSGLVLNEVLSLNAQE